MPDAAFKSFAPNRALLLGIFILLPFSLLFYGCRTDAKLIPAADGLGDRIPRKMLWAWERPEDLRFIESKEYGVAFLAQTITISGGDARVNGRRQPLEVNSDTFLTAVTRIETDKASAPKFSGELRQKVAGAVMRTLQLKNISAVQIDFDAAVSERVFYRALLSDLRAQIPPEIPFSITALASWCASGSWLEGLPVDEAVPMSFRMGADAESIRSFLGSGKDWPEPLCRKSYGFAIGEPFEKKIVSGRRIYFFSDRAWKKDDLKVTDNFY